MSNKPDIISRIHNELISYCEPLITITRRTERKRKHTKIFVIFFGILFIAEKTKKNRFRDIQKEMRKVPLLGSHGAGCGSYRLANWFRAYRGKRASERDRHIL